MNGHEPFQEGEGQGPEAGVVGLECGGEAVAPGADLAVHEKHGTPPALLEPARRRHRPLVVPADPPARDVDAQMAVAK